MLLKSSQQETRTRIHTLLLDTEVPLDLKEYLQSFSSSIVNQFEEYISRIEDDQIQIYSLRSIDLKAAQSVSQIYKYPTFVTANVKSLIEQTISNYNPVGSWSGYAWDLAWMSVRVGVEIPYGTIVFPCQIGGHFQSFACTFIPSFSCFVFGTLSEILEITQ